VKRTALAVQHVLSENLGGFEDELLDLGFATSHVDIVTDDWVIDDFLIADLLIVLDGPLSVNDHPQFPDLEAELQAITRRVRGNHATLGVGLGAQLIAQSLGATVRPAPTGTSIGYSTVALTREGSRSALSSLTNVPLLHRYHDQFDLPEGAERLAYTDQDRNEAFQVGRNILGMQFHPEVRPADIEAWILAHVSELANAHASATTIRRDASILADESVQAGRSMLRRWLNDVDWQL
jgi:GMP synthase (glutamine-hydrolysing)